MNFEERIQLLGEMRKKRIKQKDLASVSVCNCSSAWISQWFNKPEIEISEEMLTKIIDYIASK
ncbi:hypothetical protein SAMN05880501_10770 [Ureibacillus xyleni]|uniref:Helix-turn-helix protein n=1 Tax=Ureibacillus xyleni TaxID=614648 RepID=A0A285SXW0_9BACL|nr:hypothetical protein [Ureibacillus xyleni]SOC12894.1 hypothetical protein SAMN05880501_10770 [Ureibacillus xyleni]